MVEMFVTFVKKKSKKYNNSNRVGASSRHPPTEIEVRCGFPRHLSYEINFKTISFTTIL